MTKKPTSDHSVINDALNLDGSPEAVRRYYDNWAENYDRDMQSFGYLGPRFMADLFDRHSGRSDGDRPSMRILDAGCGTGLLGEELSQLDYPPIDGFDLSPEMARQAADRSGYGQVLGDIDIMSADNAFEPGSYDAVLCAGVFTLGHVAPDALNVLLRLASPDGLVVISTRSQYYDTTDYRQVAGALIDAGHMSLVEAVTDSSYIDGSTSHFWVYRKAAM